MFLVNRTYTRRRVNVSAPEVRKFLVDSGELRATVASLFEAVGVSPTHADEIAEIEINPLICTKDRAIIADTLLVKGTT